MLHLIEAIEDEYKFSTFVSEVGLLTVCKRGDAEDWSAYSLVPPERVWCYGPSYFTAFRDRAYGATTKFGDTALQRYVRPVLLWNDIAFAVLTGLFAMFADVAISAAASSPVTQFVFTILAVLGIVYGIVDVTEDLVLVHLLESRSGVAAGQVKKARTLTRLKMLTLTLSLAGAVLFFGLIIVRSLYRRIAG